MDTDKIVKKITSAVKMAAALARREELDDLIAEARAKSGLDKLEKERADLEDAIKQFAVDKGDYEDEHYRVTRVQGHSRKWDGLKLEKLLPKGIFLKVVDYTPNPEKIDALVKEGKIDRKKIQAAFIETPNKPYGKITRKTEGSDGATEADSLAAKLG